MKIFLHKQQTSILAYYPVGWTWRLQLARSGAGRVAMDSCVVCTKLYVWVLCNLRPDTVTHLWCIRETYGDIGCYRDAIVILWVLKYCKSTPLK